MNLYQQVASEDKIIKRLKNTITALTKAKNEFVNRAIEAEKLTRNDSEQEVNRLLHDIFVTGIGISDDDIRKIMRVRVSSKHMDLDQQVTAGNKVIKRLKDTITTLMQAKNEFVHRVIDALVDKTEIFETPKAKILTWYGPEECLDKLSQHKFASGTGLSDDEIRKIMRVRVSSKQMDLDQQVAAGNKVIRRLKDTSTTLMIAKNEYVNHAVEREKLLTNGSKQTLMNFSHNIFAVGTGIADDELRKIMRVRVSSKQMDLYQLVAAGNKIIKRLKDTITALMKAKNDFVNRAVDEGKVWKQGKRL